MGERRITTRRPERSLEGCSPWARPTKRKQAREGLAGWASTGPSRANANGWRGNRQLELAGERRRRQCRTGRGGGSGPRPAGSGGWTPNRGTAGLGQPGEDGGGDEKAPVAAGRSRGAGKAATGAGERRRRRGMPDGGGAALRRRRRRGQARRGGGARPRSGGARAADGRAGAGPRRRGAGGGAMTWRRLIRRGDVAEGGGHVRCRPDVSDARRKTRLGFHLREKSGRGTYL